MLTYFLLDNNPKEQSDSIVRKINMSDSIKIIPVELEGWEIQVPQIISNIDQTDGILLDWRLYEPTEKSDISYSAEALAQHFRFLYNDGQLQKDIPIVLCSANPNFINFYDRDASGHDLFVAVYGKDDFSEKAEEVVNQLTALAEAFKLVQGKTKPTPKSLLDIPSGLNLDSRLEGELLDLITNFIPHNLIKFLLDEVIQRPGVLINEDLLASRLGLAREKSEDWKSLVSEVLFPEFGYTGVLSKGWQRWWADGFINWWKTKISPKHPQYYGAEERAKLLRAQTGKENLFAAEKLKFCASEEFWTICEATRRPIDLSDGLRIQTENLRPWQEEQFVSLYSILERKKSIKLNPIEKERFIYLKNLATKNGKD